MRRRHRVGLALLSLVSASVAWLCCLHLFFTPSGAIDAVAGPGSQRARQLTARFVALWSGEPDGEGWVAWARQANPEWDFMARTFQVMALANLALDRPADRAELLAVMDHILGDTLDIEARLGATHFLMSYWRRAPFVIRPPRSLFVDGEIAVMLGMRRLVEERADWAEEHRRRVDVLVTRMEQSPVLSGESYPDECWTFCNTYALLAIRLADVLGPAAD
jgi:hypothetical protein